MATYSQQEANFIATELPLAQVQSARTGIPVSVFLTQSANETGWGTSSWFLQHNNPAGIGVTGAAGAGSTYPNLAAAFQDYADKLLGHGEAGQQQFAADVSAKASPQQLLSDLEASPWAGGKYGGPLVNGVRQPGTALNESWASNGLGTFDAPGAKPPTGATQIQTVAYIPGTGVHIPGTGSGSSILPSNPVTDAVGGAIGSLLDFIKQGAIRTALVVFGLVAILIGLALLVHDESQDHADDSAGENAGRTEEAASKAEEPAERSRPQPATQSASASGGGHSGAVGGGGGVADDAAEAAAV